MDGFSVRRLGYALARVALFEDGANALVEPIARGVVGDAYGDRRRRRAIERLRGHGIVCGSGRIGRRVAVELRAREPILAR